MDSLGGLSDTLPRGSAMEATEKELQTAFRQSALALTGLFKVGKKATRRAYIAGKKEALQDVLEFLQASLDHPLVHSETSSLSGPPGQLNVARLIDYICARQETLQAEEEGDQDEEESSTAPSPHHPTTHSTSTQHPRPSAGGSSRSASSLFASRSSAAASTAAAPSTAAPLRPQSAPPSRLSIATSPIASTSAPSSPPLSTSTTPQFRDHPAPFAAQRPSFFSQSSATACAPSSPLASGSMAPTSTSGSGTRRRSNIGSGANANPARKSASGRSSSSTSGSRDRSNNIDASAGSPSSSSPSAIVDAALGSSVGAMKRRFHTVSVAELVDLERQQESGTAAVVLAKPAASALEGGELDAHEGDGSEDIDMEMDGWDGVGERPPKRVLRTR
ncbi:BQ2448_548 [Microbotryum intermedium]|uniref:BQ2448_548 protein n=1 Tax=Microbotryum intermedium TaxID=269621 RepID=A0A238F5S5_9BASI|nr:BQ2448_548 [Microbotryum intermedium]